MSRIEKAIESATLKRNRKSEDQSGAETPLDSKTDQGMVSTRFGQGMATKVDNPFLVTANDQNSPAAEQYRKLKSLVVHLSKNDNFDKALMVTSPAANEGKTITSLNLAITLAQDFDHTVLLVEADVRKPAILEHFGIKAQKGLSDCVVDGVDIGDVLIKTDIGNLSILSAGQQVDNPVELFSSKKMSSLFDEIRTRYQDRYVIVDTTPLLPFAEPQYIAKAIGGVLLVVREGVTTPDSLRRSLEMLKNTTLFGVVNNCVNRVHSMDGYYGYYGYEGYSAQKLR